MFEKNLSYSAINTARSALSTVIVYRDTTNFGSHPLVIKFMKGVFQLKPPKPRYDYIWDVNLVLNFLRTLSPVHLLSLKDLTLKLVMLIALITAERSQTIHLLAIDEMKEGKAMYSFGISEHVKQSRPGYGARIVKFKAYPPDRRLCICTVLKEYLSRTKSLRGSEKKLLLSYIKPYNSVSSDTVKRWIKVVMAKAGINTDVFKPHSTRAASVSAAKQSSVSVKDIMSAAGWTVTSTFAKYYDKKIIQDSNYATKILKHNM